jgi:hypothetical protein
MWTKRDVQRLACCLVGGFGIFFGSIGLAPSHRGVVSHTKLAGMVNPPMPGATLG